MRQRKQDVRGDSGYRASCDERPRSDPIQHFPPAQATEGEKLLANLKA